MEHKKVIEIWITNNQHGALILWAACGHFDFYLTRFLTLQAMEIYFVLYIIYSHGTVTKVTKGDIG